MQEPTIIKKEGYTETDEVEESFVEEIPSQYYGDPKKQIHFINRFLSKHAKSKQSVLELMSKDNGCKIIKPQNWIMNPAGSLIHPGQLFEAYNVSNSSGVRCVICKDVLDWNTILEHLQGSYNKGHKLSTEKTIKLFAREFYNWNYRDSKFTYRGEDIKA